MAAKQCTHAWTMYTCSTAITFVNKKIVNIISVHMAVKQCAHAEDVQYKLKWWALFLISYVYDPIWLTQQFKKTANVKISKGFTHAIALLY